ncbi:hypothetical protein AAVH_17868 [Aphelenchoides avenae]|nr:hypothetical protein AAVH_17868 [Aphelenchus avenae]
MAELTASNKGKPCRYVEGFSMLQHKMIAKGTLIRWRCSKYTTCKAYGVSATTDGEFKLLQKHNHVADPASPVQTVNRVRKVKGAALADKKPDQLVLPDELTKTLRGDKFLLVDSRQAEPAEPAFFAFASPHGVKLLREHKEWCTFYAAAKHFDNLLTVNVLIGQSSVPAVYVLLPNRLEATYRRAFRAIFGTPELTDVAPTSYLTDFEKALQNVLKEMFPRARGRLCHFHQCQAYFKNIQKKGLLPLYEIEEVKVMLRCYGALALLPVDDVINGYNVVTRALKALVPAKIPSCYRDRLNAYCTYIRKTYIGTVVGNRLVRSRYDYSNWNCFEQTVHGDARTNNAVEGWHAWLNARFPRAHPPMSQFIIRIQKEEERTFNLVTRLAWSGPTVSIRPKTCAGVLRAIPSVILQTLAVAYGDTPREERDILQYLRAAQYHLSPSAWKRLREEQDKENEAAELVELEQEGSASQDVEQEAGASQLSIPADAEACSSQRSIPVDVESVAGEVLLPTQVSQRASPLPSTSWASVVSMSPASAAYRKQLRGFSFFDEGDE